MRGGYIFHLQQDTTVPLLCTRVSRSWRMDNGLRGRCRIQPVDPSHSQLIVDAGYAWDGCTPKFDVFGLLLGAPELAPRNNLRVPASYHASLVHDVMYENAFAFYLLGIDRLQMDLEFYQQLRAHGAPRLLAGIYYLAVRVGGWWGYRRWWKYGRTSLAPE